jgi:hypothetical protein
LCRNRIDQLLRRASGAGRQLQLAVAWRRIKDLTTKLNSKANHAAPRTDRRQVVTKNRTTRTVAAATIALASTALSTAALASAWWPFDAQGPNIQKFGTREDLFDGAGTIVQSWTVNGLKPSSDVIPYSVQGRLWEANASDEAIRGSVTPVISDMNARAPHGQTYRVIFNVAVANGLNPATLEHGQKTSGKLYFDVTGEDPGSVVYNNLIQDLLIWVK